MKTIRILFVGDIVGNPGCAVFQKHIATIREKHNVDALIVNGENSADGRGITPKLMEFFTQCGVNMVTSGNHIWYRKDIYPYIAHHTNLLRPLNFPSVCPGSGIGTFIVNGVSIGVINVQGRVFMKELVQCPLKAVDSAITFLKSRTSVIFVDMHAEATSEKMALAFYCDGQVSAVVGTHTHVQTADERILPQGTAYISDVGMAGALNSVIGTKKQNIIQSMLTQMPVRFEVESQGPYLLCGVFVDVDPETGRAVDIKRLRIIDEASNLTIS